MVILGFHEYLENQNNAQHAGVHIGIAEVEGGKEMKAAIYCRVSTEDQKSEGTSLQTQREACRDYCQGKVYDMAYRFSEDTFRRYCASVLLNKTPSAQ